MSGAAVDTAASFMRESLSPADRFVRADILRPEDSAGLKRKAQLLLQEQDCGFRA